MAHSMWNIRNKNDTCPTEIQTFSASHQSILLFYHCVDEECIERKKYDEIMRRNEWKTQLSFKVFDATNYELFVQHMDCVRAICSNDLFLLDILRLISLYSLIMLKYLLNVEYCSFCRNLSRWSIASNELINVPKVIRNAQPKAYEIQSRMNNVTIILCRCVWPFGKNTDHIDI